MILEAEKFKASIAPKPGKSDDNRVGQLVNQLKQSRVHDGDCDDEFFHITYHIDPALKEKIEKGQFVDLEKLLPRDKSQMLKEDNVMQFHYRDGNAYWAPANSDKCISNVRKWEQAFRLYAAIYSEANPLRSSEIWQYVYVVNHAAMSYTWKNVSFYDITFRHLMEKHPNHSWAKTYTQMWNIAMTDLLSKTHKFAPSHATRSGTPNCPKYCWKYNKNRLHPGNCDFVHRCSYCDCGCYGRWNCLKRKREGNRDGWNVNQTRDRMDTGVEKL